MDFSRVVMTGVTAICILLSGCAATPYHQLVPSLLGERAAPTGPSISIASVTSSYSYNPLLESTLPKVSVETFRAALTETLRKAYLSTSTPAVPDETYRLSANILSEQIAGGYDNIITVLIRYELERGGKQIWSENILSQGQLSTKNVFSGAERHRLLQIGAFQDNLAALVEKLNTAIRGR